MAVRFSPKFPICILAQTARNHDTGSTRFETVLFQHLRTSKATEVCLPLTHDAKAARRMLRTHFNPPNPMRIQVMQVGDAKSLASLLEDLEGIHPNLRLSFGPVESIHQLRKETWPVRQAIQDLEDMERQRKQGT